MIHNIIESLDMSDINLETVPMADGGEYSNEVLLNSLNCKKVSVSNIVNPYGKKVESHYLELGDNSVFIGSSEILGLSPSEDKYKNPLNLTSYGFGQLILDAINKDYKNIYLGLGGTSTVDGGIGMIQALGGVFYGNGNVIKGSNKYLMSHNLLDIDKIDLSKISEKIENIKITAVCDAGINLEEMYTPNNQKISNYHNDKRKNIINTY